LNPSVTHNSEGGGGAQVFTDDVSLRVFMEHCKLTYCYVCHVHNTSAHNLHALFLLLISDEIICSVVIRSLMVQVVTRKL
jgi:hypothetical protein